MHLEYGKGTVSISVPHERILALLQPKEARVILVTNAELAKDLRGTYIEAVTSVDEALAKAEGYTDRKAKITVLRKARRLIIS